MSNNCSFANLLAAGIRIFRNIGIGITGILAFMGVMLGLIYAGRRLCGAPADFRDDPASRVLYIACGLSFAALVALGLYKNWRTTVAGTAELVGRLGVGGFCVWYLHWLSVHVEGVWDNPFRVFWPKHVSLSLWLELIPAQIVVAAFCFFIVAFVVVIAWESLRGMCAYGAEIREEKTTKSKCAPVPTN
jgi:hypothetical protein